MYQQALQHAKTGEAPSAPGRTQDVCRQPPNDTSTSVASAPVSPTLGEALTVKSMIGSFVAAVFVFMVAIVLLKGLDATAGNVRPGAILATTDLRQQPKDHIVEFKKGIQRTSMLIWDFAAEDGDQVEILVNGQQVRAPFVIKHAPVAVDVPVGAVVEVRGVVDGGGGGITYAVNFPELPRSILNSAEAGSANKYTLVMKQ